MIGFFDICLQTNSSTILEWDFALGRSDVITSTYLDVAVGTRLILTLIGYDEVLQETVSAPIQIKSQSALPSPNICPLFSIRNNGQHSDIV